MLFTFAVMIKIYVTIYLEREREKIKVIGLVGPMGRRICFSTFTVQLSLFFESFYGINKNTMKETEYSM